MFVGEIYSLISNIIITVFRFHVKFEYFKARSASNKFQSNVVASALAEFASA